MHTVGWMQEGAAGMAPPALQLSELVDSFFADNHLECKCEKCGSDAAMATHKIKALPRHLVLPYTLNTKSPQLCVASCLSRMELPLRRIIVGAGTFCRSGL